MVQILLFAKHEQFIWGRIDANLYIYANFEDPDFMKGKGRERLLEGGILKWHNQRKFFDIFM